MRMVERRNGGAAVLWSPFLVASGVVTGSLNPCDRFGAVPPLPRPDAPLPHTAVPPWQRFAYPLARHPGGRVARLHVSSPEAARCL